MRWISLYTSKISNTIFLSLQENVFKKILPVSTLVFDLNVKAGDDVIMGGSGRGEYCVGDGME